MRLRLLAALAVCAAAPGLSACDGGPDGCWDRRDDYVRIDPLGSSLPLPPSGRAVTGVFVSWGAGEVLFDALDGQTYGFGIEVLGAPVLPDLAALGSVDLIARGFEGSSLEPTAPVLQVFAPGRRDALWVALGNQPLDVPGSRLTVTAPRDQNTCIAYKRDNGLARNKPVTVGMGDDQAVLFQGERAALGELEVTIVSAQSNNRAHPWAPCSEADCPWEKLAWIVTAADVPDLAVPPGTALP